MPGEATLSENCFSSSADLELSLITTPPSTHPPIPTTGLLHLQPIKALAAPGQFPFLYFENFELSPMHLSLFISELNGSETELIQDLLVFTFSLRNVFVRKNNKQTTREEGMSTFCYNL